MLKSDIIITECDNDTNNNMLNVFIRIKQGTTGQKLKNNSGEELFFKAHFIVLF